MKSRKQALIHFDFSVECGSPPNRPPETVLCGRKLMKVQVASTDESDVTCRACLKILEKEAAEIEEGRAMEASCRRPVEPPPVGQVVLLHQITDGDGTCGYCGKPRDDWEPMQPCPVREEDEP